MEATILRCCIIFWRKVVGNGPRTLPSSLFAVFLLQHVSSHILNTVMSICGRLKSQWGLWLFCLRVFFGGLSWTVSTNCALNALRPHICIFLRTVHFHFQSYSTLHNVLSKELSTLKDNSHIRGCASTVPWACRVAPIHTYRAVPLPCSDSAFFFVKVRVVFGKIHTTYPLRIVFMLMFKQTLNIETTPFVFTSDKYLTSYVEMNEEMHVGLCVKCLICPQDQIS
jgi:hypothetical protein